MAFWRRDQVPKAIQIWMVHEPKALLLPDGRDMKFTMEAPFTFFVVLSTPV